MLLAKALRFPVLKATFLRNQYIYKPMNISRTIVKEVEDLPRRIISKTPATDDANESVPQISEVSDSVDVNEPVNHPTSNVSASGQVIEPVNRRILKESSIVVESMKENNLFAPTTPTGISRVVPMVLERKEGIVLPFEDVPGPKSLKYLSVVRQYFSQFGTHLVAAALTARIKYGRWALFDEYGPVVRFVSPTGGDIVMLNIPDHISRVFAAEGQYPVRSSLDSLEKYRMENRIPHYGGIFNLRGKDWQYNRELVMNPLDMAIRYNTAGIYEISDNFTRKVDNQKNHQSEIPDLYSEIHKWSFDCMGQIIFSKKFNILDIEQVHNQCDASWFYHSLVKCTDALMRCESGLHFWKMFTTPSWHLMVRHCCNLDNMIGKHVAEVEQMVEMERSETVVEDFRFPAPRGLLHAMMIGNKKMQLSEISTLLMDMLIIGVNTVASTMSFLLYNLAKHQRIQRNLLDEIDNVTSKYTEVDDYSNILKDTPYLQICLKETLRLSPPIPVLTRILPKNIILDKYNIPRGTLIIMSTKEAALNESNFDDATRFSPERWLRQNTDNYHAFASIPFGFGSKSCLGKIVAETMISVLTTRILSKLRLEYHYGDISPTTSFIAKPNKPLKIRFIERHVN